MSNLPTRDNVSLFLAQRLTKAAEHAWQSGELTEHVAPTTAELLRYWLSPDYTQWRTVNFNEGQRRAILNTIYLHEVLGARSVLDAYEKVAPELLPLANLAQLAEPKYAYPKYGIKMATGTGKTWVMHALLIWQMLGARHEPTPSGRFTQKFLIIAPNIIVYERLLDAFVGRQASAEGGRDVLQNDYSRNSALLLPPTYRDEVLSFVQSNTVCREDIGRKVTGEGLIALTNWQQFVNQLNGDDENGAATAAADGPSAIVNGVLPLRPGKAAGNDLNAIDAREYGHTTLDYLSSLPDLMVVNDEAHHVHGQGGSTGNDETDWQQALSNMAAGKARFFQVDFSATLYDMVGSGKKVRKKYFPHIIADFDLPQAIRKGLVKLLLLDNRNKLTNLPQLDFRSRRVGRRIVGLSEGQRVMLRAGLTKLRRLEHDFQFDASTKKYPKMLVVCEETQASPFVHEFLLEEGLDERDIVTIDSGQRADVTPEEWKKIKTDLFDIDNRPQPKVIISVMMLREGFDVNNICVLVALRAAQSKILVEQLIGRGLRLMWRDNDEVQELKARDRDLVLNKGLEPKTLLDTLSIIEHPAFNSFYDELRGKGVITDDTGSAGSGGSVGDMISVGLRPDYADYDLTWPQLTCDVEEDVSNISINPAKLWPFTSYSLERLRKFLATEGIVFSSQEILTQTTFGPYRVTGDLFKAETYRDYLRKILHVVTVRIESRRYNNVPSVQVNAAHVMEAIDVYIRKYLFKEPFDPFQGNDWKILLAKNGVVTSHIVGEVVSAIYRQLTNAQQLPAEVKNIPFSSVATLSMRASHSVEVRKCIYERAGYAANGGNLEKDFIDFIEKDGTVQKFVKINEARHLFATIIYLNKDGLPARYFPDFLVATNDKLYVVETKADNPHDAENVRRKQTATTEWVEKINSLPASKRMYREWLYVLIRQTTFYRLRAGGANLHDLAQQCAVSSATAAGRLF